MMQKKLVVKMIDSSEEFILDGLVDADKVEERMIELAVEDKEERIELVDAYTVQ